MRVTEAKKYDLNVMSINKGLKESYYKKALFDCLFKHELEMMIMKANSAVDKVKE